MLLMWEDFSKYNFYKDVSKKDGPNPVCKVCMIEYYNEKHERKIQYQKLYAKQNRARTNIFEKNRKTDVNFELICNLRSRTSSAIKSQNVRRTNRTTDLISCSQSFFKSWIFHQLYGIKTLENYGKIWCLDHCLANASFNLSDQKETKKCFNWINLKPMYVKGSIIKGDEIDYHLYLPQEVKTKYFMKLDAQEGYY